MSVVPETQRRSLVAGLRTFSDLAPGGRRLAYLVVLAGLTVVYGLAATRHRAPTERSSAPGRTA